MSRFYDRNYDEIQENKRNLYVAAAVVGGAVVNGVMQANAAQSAAQTESAAGAQASANTLAAEQQAIGAIQGAYNTGLGVQNPYLQTGGEANSAYANWLGLGTPQLPTDTSTAAPPTGNAPQNPSTPSNPVATPGVQTTGLGPQTTVGGSPTSSVSPTSSGSPSTAAAPTANAPQAPTGIGPTQTQLNQGASATTTGGGLQMFNNQDLNAQLAPNYSFVNQQNLQNLKASLAATGDLQTGQGLKDIVNYSTNNAQNAYQQAFNNWNTQNNQIAQRLQYGSTQGQGAANTVAQLSGNTGSNIASTVTGSTAASNNYLTGAASANAAGQIGTANAIGGAFTGATNGYLGANIYQNMLNNQTNANGTANTAITDVNNASTPNYQLTPPGYSGVGLNPSDRRLKRDIRNIGMKNNLPLYTYKYIWDDKINIGHMADEVEKVYPNAVRYTKDGFAMVDYSIVGEK